MINSFFMKFCILNSFVSLKILTVFANILSHLTIINKKFLNLYILIRYCLLKSYLIIYMNYTHIF